MFLFKFDAVWSMKFWAININKSDNLNFETLLIFLAEVVEIRRHLMNLLTLFLASELNKYTLVWNHLPPSFSDLGHHACSASFKNPTLNCRRKLYFWWLEVLLHLSCSIEYRPSVSTFKIFHEDFTVIILIFFILLLLDDWVRHELSCLFNFLLFYLFLKRRTS